MVVQRRRATKHNIWPRVSDPSPLNQTLRLINLGWVYDYDGGGVTVFRGRWYVVAVVLFLQAWPAQVYAQREPQSAAPPASSPAKPDEIELTPADPAKDQKASAVSRDSTEKIPNFSSCTIDELRQIVPELKGLKPAPDQSELRPLLAKIGAEAKEIVRRTPNLISHESVISGVGFSKTRKDFSYLVLTHAEGSDRVVFDEFRTDLATGEKMYTEDVEKQAAAQSAKQSTSTKPLELPADLPKTSVIQPAESGPLAQGFANAWTHFYPVNQPESDFRYLGEQKMNGHRTVVLAFAEKPGWVLMPAMLRLENKASPVFFQGVAWVDGGTYRIVRLHTDLLAPVLGLKRLSADIEFGEVRIADVASPLWLPHEVAVNSKLGDGILNETHKYSDFRLFRTRSRIVLNP
jgi:hypothetical protein